MPQHGYPVPFIQQRSGQSDYGRSTKPSLKKVRHTPGGSLHYTAEWQFYATLKLPGDRVAIREEKCRPLGQDYINGVEEFWSCAKLWLMPYRGFPKNSCPCICQRFTSGSIVELETFFHWFYAC